MEALLALLVVIALLSLFAMYAIYRSMDGVRKDLHNYFDHIIPPEDLTTLPNGKVVYRPRAVYDQWKVEKLKDQKASDLFYQEYGIKPEPRAIIAKPRTKGEARKAREEKNTPEIAKLSPEQMKEKFEGPETMQATGNPLDNLLPVKS